MSWGELPWVSGCLLSDAVATRGLVARVTVLCHFTVLLASCCSSESAVFLYALLFFLFPKDKCLQTHSNGACACLSLFVLKVCIEMCLCACKWRGSCVISHPGWPLLSLLMDCDANLLQQLVCQDQTEQTEEKDISTFFVFLWSPKIFSPLTGTYFEPFSAALQFCSKCLFFFPCMLQQKK